MLRRLPAYCIFLNANKRPKQNFANDEHLPDAPTERPYCILDWIEVFESM